MSICTCSECGQFIDSDFDPGCFVAPAFAERVEEIILCDLCREEADLPDEPVNSAGIHPRFDTTIGWSGP